MKNLLTIIIILVIIALVKQDQLKDWLKNWLEDQTPEAPPQPNQGVSFDMQTLIQATKTYFGSNPIAARSIAMETRSGITSSTEAAIRAIMQIAPEATYQEAQGEVNKYVDLWKASKYGSVFRRRAQLEYERSFTSG